MILRVMDEVPLPAVSSPSPPQRRPAECGACPGFTQRGCQDDCGASKTGKNAGAEISEGFGFVEGHIASNMACIWQYRGYIGLWVYVAMRKEDPVENNM